MFFISSGCILVNISLWKFEIRFFVKTCGDEHLTYIFLCWLAPPYIFLYKFWIQNFFLKIRNLVFCENMQWTYNFFMLTMTSLTCPSWSYKMPIAFVFFIGSSWILVNLFCEKSEKVFSLNYVVNSLLTIFYADDDVVDLPLLILQDADCFYVFYW